MGARIPTILGVSTGQYNPFGSGFVNPFATSPTITPPKKPKKPQPVLPTIPPELLVPPPPKVAPTATTPVSMLTSPTLVTPPVAKPPAPSTALPTPPDLPGMIDPVTGQPVTHAATGDAIETLMDIFGTDTEKISENETKTARALREAREAERKRIKGAKGRGSTIATSARGILQQANIFRKTLLGV